MKRLDFYQEIKMPYSVCYYHIVWATKYRTPSLSAQIEDLVIRTIRQKSEDLKSPIHAINGCFDHLHISVSISTAVAISDWVKSMKGTSAYLINKSHPDLAERLRWQEGYSVHTFGIKHLDIVNTYIALQKEHHRSQTVIQYLEHIDEPSK
jgi:putative transposase